MCLYLYVNRAKYHEQTAAVPCNTQEFTKKIQFHYSHTVFLTLLQALWMCQPSPSKWALYYEEYYLAHEKMFSSVSHGDIAHCSSSCVEFWLFLSLLPRNYTLSENILSRWWIKKSDHHWQSEFLYCSFMEA